MDVIARVRKASELIRKRDEIDRQLTRMFSPNGRQPKRRKGLKKHVKYLHAISQLPKTTRVRLGKIYKKDGVQVAIAEAQKAIEKRG